MLKRGKPFLYLDPVSSAGVQGEASLLVGWFVDGQLDEAAGVCPCSLLSGRASGFRRSIIHGFPMS